MKENTPQKSQQNPSPTPTGGAFISLAQAAERTKKYREDYVYQIADKEEKIKANYFTKKNIMAIINQPGCEGVRVYNAVCGGVYKDQEGRPIDRREILIVATDKDGNDILKKTPNGGCSPLSVFMALPASKEKEEDALILGNPSPCPNICGKPNPLNGDPK